MFGRLFLLSILLLLHLMLLNGSILLLVSTLSKVLGIFFGLRGRKLIGTNWFWGPDVVPKYSFILWLALQQKMAIKSKLVHWGTVDDDTCVLCNSCSETLDHIFFQCACSIVVWKSLLKKCRIHRGVMHWRREITWFTRKASRKSLMCRIRRVLIAASVYWLWKVRNEAISNRKLLQRTELFRK